MGEGVAGGAAPGGEGEGARPKSAPMVNKHYMRGESTEKGYACDWCGTVSRQPLRLGWNVGTLTWWTAILSGTWLPWYDGELQARKLALLND